MHPVSFFSKNSICNVNTRGFQSPDFGIPPISSLKQKLDSVKEHLIVCAQCVIFWIDFWTARKEIFIVKTPLAGWKFQNLTHIFRDHSLLAKFWILFPLNLKSTMDSLTHRQQNMELELPTLSSGWSLSWAMKQQVLS